MKIYSIAGILALGLTLAPSAPAVPVYGTAADFTGSRSTELGGGLEFSRGSPNGDLGLDWTIADNSNGSFDYEYTFEALNGLGNPSISHLTLDLTDNCVDPGDPECVTDFELDGNSAGPLEFGDLDGITGAVKFDTEGDLDPTLTYSFTSNRAPVWGDAFIKEGTWDARNIGFGNRTSEDANLYIARPNGLTQVPSPGPLSLIGLGLLGLGWVFRNSLRIRIWPTG